MSWHCGICGDVDNNKTWTQINISFIDGGIPINVVCHAECLRNTFSLANTIVDDIDSKIVDIKETKADLKSIKKNKS